MTNQIIFKRLFESIKPYKTKLIISMISMVFVALFTGAQTYLVKDLIDKIFIAKNEYYLFGLTMLVLIIFGLKGHLLLHLPLPSRADRPFHYQGFQGENF